MVNNYFYKIDSLVFGDDLADKIANLTISNSKSFRAYHSHLEGKLDNNWFLTRGIWLDIPEVRELINSCVLKCYPLVLRHFPNVQVPIHKDDPNGRNTVLIFPIRPKTDYVPTLFYEYVDSDISSPIATCDFSDGVPALVNTQCFHGLTNNDNLRINFQLCFNEPFEQVRDLAINKQLFKC